MTSSTITGDRRWGSARRGGMTVLGKVAVPKPINLPSQRLENHGLDPNVEIVPKGTLSWGSRPSSSGSNAWATSTLSPSTDGGSSSPSHLVGRPSSGGGTRPSTSGSEKAHDSSISAWGSNSRPSSASGGLTSSHTSSTSLRPRSADTRPGSSHLSRFAEPVPEGSRVWSATSAPERMGVVSSEKGFSLSSGDFPTLGSEKDESKTNMEPLDHPFHGEPDSSDGVRIMADNRGIIHSDDISGNSYIKGDSWRKDSPSFIKDGPQPNFERWHGEPHLYPNPNMEAPPHYEPWRGGPPVNPPSGVWFRGPPYGGYPIEPFPYYRPHIPPSASHHGLHPKNGDVPRMPHIPLMNPGMPMRPGFYPGPVPYEGYYRPSLGFGNPNDRDLPFMGMPPHTPVYGRQARPESREGKVPEHPCGYNVPINANECWNKNEEEKWGHRMNNNTSEVNREKGILSKPPLEESSWGDDFKKDEDKFSNVVNASSLKFSKHSSNIDGAQMDPAMENVSFSQDQSLMQKIEGLNAKARASSRKEEGFYTDESNNRIHISQSRDHQYAKGRFLGLETDGWRKEIDSQPGSNLTTIDQLEDHKNTIVSDVDVSDMQRAKMREMAKQRAIQLQKEEEERVREQRAKALAKLEELNRRSASQSVESSSQKDTTSPPGDAPKKTEFSRNQQEPSDEVNTGSNSTSVNKTFHINESNTSETLDSSASSSHFDTEDRKYTQKDDNFHEGNNDKRTPQIHEVSRHKRGGYKQRQNVLPEKNNIQSVQKDVKVSSQTQEVSDNFFELGAEKPIAESTVSIDSSFQKRKVKVNKIGKNSQKIEESSSIVTSLSEDLVPQVNNTGMFQHSRKPRNTQNNKSSDKTHSNDTIFWAPIRSRNKLEDTEKTTRKDVEPLLPSPIGDNSVPNSSKIKRAEIERYVPKPVSKETTCQESNIEQPFPSIDVGSCGREEASRGSGNFSKGRANMKSKHVDGKNIETLNGSRLDPGFERGPQSKPEQHSEKNLETPIIDGWGFVVEDSGSNTSATFFVEKDHAPSGRGKRRSSKGQKSGTRYQTIENKESNPGLTEIESSYVEEIQFEVSSSKGSRVGGDRNAFHWQPKSHPQGKKSNWSQNFASEQNNEAGPQKPGSGRHETKRERKVGPAKGGATPTFS